MLGTREALSEIVSMPNDSKSMDGETLEVLWAFKRVNDTLIAGLEFAVHTMEKWDSL